MSDLVGRLKALDLTTLPDDDPSWSGQANRLMREAAAKIAELEARVAVTADAEEMRTKLETENGKLKLDLKCLEESTVDVKAWEQAQAKIAELEAELAERNKWFSDNAAMLATHRIGGYQFDNSDGLISVFQEDTQP